MLLLLRCCLCDHLVHDIYGRCPICRDSPNNEEDGYSGESQLQRRLICRLRISHCNFANSYMIFLNIEKLNLKELNNELQFFEVHKC